MIIHNCEQRSAIWYNLRLGKITGSNAHKLTTKTKFDTYYYELLAETITRNIKETRLTEEMQWAIDNEPFATEWYQEQANEKVTICGFIEHDKYIFGCSPDLLAGDKGMGQIKCFASKNHLYYRDHGADKEITYQMQWEMFVAEREWNDLILYDPRCKELEGFVHRIERNDKIIKELSEKAHEMQDRIEFFLFENNIKTIKYVPPAVYENAILLQQHYDQMSYLRA